MQIGRLRNLIEVWKYVEQTDAFGEPIKNYTLITKAYAEIRPLLGTETFNEKEVHTEHTHKILMRYIPTPIDATMQIRYGTRIFEVHGQPSNWMERDIQLIFNCTELFDHDLIHKAP